MIESADAAKCGAYNMHGEHIYRTGWFWSKKNHCSGAPFPGQTRDLKYPEDWRPPSAALKPKVEDRFLLPMEIVSHRHSFTLVEGFSVESDRFLRKPESDLLWECDWFDCKELFVIDRDIWHRQGVPYDVF